MKHTKKKSHQYTQFGVAVLIASGMVAGFLAMGGDVSSLRGQVQPPVAGSDVGIKIRGRLSMTSTTPASPFSIVVSNFGSRPSFGLTYRLIIPESFMFTSIASGCVLSDQTMTCTSAGPLRMGSSLQKTAMVKWKETEHPCPIDDIYHQFVATVQTESEDPNLANNTANHTVTFECGTGAGQSSSLSSSVAFSEGYSSSMSSSAPLSSSATSSSPVASADLKIQYNNASLGHLANTAYRGGVYSYGVIVENSGPTAVTNAKVTTRIHTAFEPQLIPGCSFVRENLGYKYREIECTTSYLRSQGRSVVQVARVSVPNNEPASYFCRDYATVSTVSAGSVYDPDLSNNTTTLNTFIDRVSPPC